MAKIKAVGKRRSEYLVIDVVDGDISVDGVKNDKYDFLLKEQVTLMGGSYYPDKGTMINIYNNLQFNFFDDTPKIKTSGDIGEIPYEDDFIY